MSIKITSATLALLLPFAAADIPVHCLTKDVLGGIERNDINRVALWSFDLSAPFPSPSSCGHEVPDKPHQQPMDLYELDLQVQQVPLTVLLSRRIHEDHHSGDAFPHQEVVF
mgnify:CR=1 FL=1